MPYASVDRKREAGRNYAARPDVRAHRQATYARWSTENKDRILAKEARRRLGERAKCLIATARTRAHRRGLAFNLDQYVHELQARIDKGACELTGEPFDLSPGRKFNSPSIDRIDPSSGYTYDNVRVVLNMVNTALGDWGEATLAAVMRRWLLK